MLSRSVTEAVGVGALRLLRRPLARLLAALPPLPPLLMASPPCPSLLALLHALLPPRLPPPSRPEGLAVSDLL